MYPVLIGSRALQHWMPELKLKPSTDWDVISYGTHEGCEVHDPAFLNNKHMTGYASSEKVKLPCGSEARVMTMLGLAILKRSHLWRDLNFQRHITMYHKFGLKDTIYDVISSSKHSIVKKDLVERTLLTMKAFPVRTPNLNQNVEDFFNDAVTKVYNHDTLHEILAYEDKPLYTRLLKEEGKVFCSESKWFELTEDQKLKCVAEEVQVIAAERFLIPKNFKGSSKLAYVKSLDKVCTTLCSGYFRYFAIDNYKEILELYDSERFLMLESKLQNVPKIMQTKNQVKEL